MMSADQGENMRRGQLDLTILSPLLSAFVTIVKSSWARNRSATAAALAVRIERLDAVLQSVDPPLLMVS